MGKRVKPAGKSCVVYGIIALRDGRLLVLLPTRAEARRMLARFPGCFRIERGIYRPGGRA